MFIAPVEGFEKSRMKALLDHFAAIEDPREPWRVAHPLPEVMLLVVCGTICDCDDYDLIADWGTTAIPKLLERLGANDGLKGALVSIDAIATNAAIATAIRKAGADYLLAVKANQPTLRGEIERYFDDVP